MTRAQKMYLLRVGDLLVRLIGAALTAWPFVRHLL
jgi:hypothetical protein